MLPRSPVHMRQPKTEPGNANQVLSIRQYRHMQYLYSICVKSARMSILKLIINCYPMCRNDQNTTRN
jgi:hypothetical protein